MSADRSITRLVDADDYTTAVATSVNGRHGAVTLTAADMPGSVVQSVTLNTGGVIHQTPVTFSVAAGAAAGTLVYNAQAANVVFAGPTTGAAAGPTFRALVSADLPAGATLVGPTTLKSSSAAGNAAVVLSAGNTASITQVSLTGNVATITTPSPHGFVSGRRVTLSGLATAALNGTFTISGVTSLTFTFSKANADIATTADSGAATSTTQTAPALAANDALGNTLASLDANGALSLTSPDGATTGLTLNRYPGQAAGALSITSQITNEWWFQSANAIKFSLSQPLKINTSSLDGQATTKLTSWRGPSDVSVSSALDSSPALNLLNSTAAGPALNVGTTATAVALSLRANGNVQWGPGSGTTFDTTLARGASGGLLLSTTLTDPLLRLARPSSTGALRNVGQVDATYATNTDASWKGRTTLSAGDFSSTNTGMREGVRVESDGTQPLLSFFGGTAAAKPALSYSRSAAGETAAGAAIRQALASLGLVTDNTTA